MTAQQIADLAKRQREGRFTTESDALLALDLIEQLAKLVADHLPDNPQE